MWKLGLVIVLSVEIFNIVFAKDCFWRRQSFAMFGLINFFLFKSACVHNFSSKWKYPVD